jgi:hypothetical protein
MEAVRAAFLVAVAACGNPPLSITLEIDTSSSSTCAAAASCEDISLSCEPYTSIRIVDPDQPKSPYVSLCQPVLLDHNADLCSLSNVQLPAGVKVPSQSLAVEVVIYAKNELSTDIKTGEPICPSDIEFTEETGFPVEGTPPPVDEPENRPAIGGRAFYHPGDSETVVRLGCSDLTLITPGCDSVLTSVQAGVVDFDNPRVSVSDDTADNLTLRVGEPDAVGSSFTFEATNTSILQRTPDEPPRWTFAVNKAFASSACVQVLDEGTGETTPTLTCLPTTPKSPVDITAVRLAKASLDQILTAIGKSSFPDAGLVVGLVLDSNGLPKAGVTAMPTDGTTHVQYLSADRKTLVTGMTSASGIFVSQDAPYTTSFGASDGSIFLPPQPGGLVVGKVTIVLLQFN